MNENSHRTRTLWLCATLHGFTHLYQVALIPLYLLIRTDLGLTGDEQATLLMTVMGIAYCVPSYPMGILADRMNRKTLLAAGLAINGLAFVALAFAHSYGMVLVAAVAAGLGGSIFHPSATALVARLYPEARGRALGRMGMGGSLGFFLGPIYAGWRAASAGWREPTLELGILGLVATVAFLVLADDHHSPEPTGSGAQAHSGKLLASPYLWLMFLLCATFFSFRDFAGSGMASRVSLFLQRANGFTPRATGVVVSLIFLSATISNPLFGSLSDRGRIRWVMFVLCTAAALIAIFPWLPSSCCLIALASDGFFFRASYPMVEAGLMDSVHDSVRGRIYGLFLTLGGVVGNIGHWFVGYRVHSLGDDAAAKPGNYVGIFGTLALMVLLSLGGLACLRKLRSDDLQPASPATPLAKTTSP